MAGEPIGAEFEWLDALAARAVCDSTPLTDFQVDFVMRLSDRLSRFKARTLISARERAVVDDIERRMDR